jgi:hypothetical protein
VLSKSHVSICDSGIYSHSQFVACVALLLLQRAHAQHVAANPCRDVSGLNFDGNGVWRGRQLSVDGMPCLRNYDDAGDEGSHSS